MKEAEVVDQVDMSFSRVGGDDLHLGAEVLVERVGVVHDSDDKHLDPQRVSLSCRCVNAHGVAGVGLAVC